MSIVSLYNEDDNLGCAEIKNCTFTGKYGIGIAVDAASPRIVDCEFNDGTSDSSYYGIYGIELYHTDDVQIEQQKRRLRSHDPLDCPV